MFLPLLPYPQGFSLIYLAVIASHQGPHVTTRTRQEQACRQRWARQGSFGAHAVVAPLRRAGWCSDPRQPRSCLILLKTSSDLSSLTS